MELVPPSIQMAPVTFKIVEKVNYVGGRRYQDENFRTKVVIHTHSKWRIQDFPGVSPGEGCINLLFGNVFAEK